MFRHRGQGDAFHFLNLAKDPVSVLLRHLQALPYLVQDVVIQSGGPIHPHAPLRGHGLKDDKGRHVLRPDFHYLLTVVLRGESERSQFFLVWPGLIEGFGKRRQFPLRAPASSDT